VTGGTARKAILLVLLGTIAAFGAFDSGMASATGGSCPNADTNVADLPLPDFDLSVLCVINERRAEHQLRPLQQNGLLHDAAYIYATSMLSGQFYGHHGCLAGRNNCSTVIGRLRFLGYIQPGWAWIVGEVLRGAGPDTSTPDAVVEAWMESPPHRARVLKPKFREVGVASVRGITDAFPSTAGVTAAAEFGFRKRNG